MNGAQKHERLLSPKETGALLVISEKTLANWRSAGKGPPYLRLGGGTKARIRYPQAELWAWAHAHTGARRQVG